MSMMRRFMGTVMLVAAVAAAALWGLGVAAVNAVEDGSFFRQIATGVVGSDLFSQVLTATVEDSVGATLDNRGIDVRSLGVEEELKATIATVTDTQGVTDALVNATTEAREALSRELTDTTREPAPLLLTVDFSSPVQETLAAVPLVGDQLQNAPIPAFETQIMGAETFERVRTGYEFLSWWSMWGGYVAAALAVMAFVIFPRGFRVVPRLLYLVGFVMLGLWALVTFVTPASVVGLLPGGVEGSLGETILALIPTDSFGDFGTRALWVGVSAVAAGVAASLVIRGTEKLVSRRPRRSRDDDYWEE